MCGFALTNTTYTHHSETYCTYICLWTPFSQNIRLTCLVGMYTRCVHVSGYLIMVYLSACPTTFISWGGMCGFALTNTTYTHHSETYCTYICLWIPFSQRIMWSCLMGMHTRCVHPCLDTTSWRTSRCVQVHSSRGGECVGSS
jgi:hypothetical protein